MGIGIKEIVIIAAIITVIWLVKRYAPKPGAKKPTRAKRAK